MSTAWTADSNNQTSFVQGERWGRYKYGGQHSKRWKYGGYNGLRLLYGGRNPKADQVGRYTAKTINSTATTTDTSTSQTVWS